ncbi:transglycosylase SLT domain-containing protein [Roseomonas sp. OT10]|uniref:lytic transglycosylase domain-containing protein n=1 Tax=Roseomonas cutis TaxID=2897332 RepID=UPI001E4FD0A5|nr:transglycosylase SLT domain-containing protein [Roseomonas sp. OT10]UFN47639.1 transglycosylase SLT domain-containing protein [Roseomonas sp. OT10]
MAGRVAAACRLRAAAPLWTALLWAALLWAALLWAALQGLAGPALAEPPPPSPAVATPPVPAPPVSAGTAPATEGYAQRRARHLAALTRQAEAQGLPAAIADAVATVESAYDPRAVGDDGEVGLMQVMPATATMLGFRGPREALFEPETNIRYGIAYLAQAWSLTGGNLCRTLMKYRAGHGEERMTPLSVEYCRRALAHLAGLGSPLAAGVAVPVANAPGLSVPGRRATVRLTSAERVRLRRGQRTEADSQRFWEAHEARIQALKARSRARRG